MIPEIKKILYATDLSENARHALGYAASLANRYGAGITFLHVLEDISPFRDSLMINVLGEEKWEKLVQENTEKVLEKARERVQGFCDEVGSEMPACPFITDEIVVKVGHPAEEIMKQVRESGCDLVVMGARGLGPLADRLVGSTSRRVLKRCKKPVLIVRLP
ncbi:MAG: universal stress protein [Deltaproteobacteria bacterium]|nr:universal stress protein [Deltaproteobacteria bacterium]MBW2049845.1 universal stress protein [Deltaproteobacteria bacterium]MBW2112646.1 universal stress protein [Deltaproteobacteria bacterium]HDZ90812.1 universal stress protein [Deltaproteobacteria bacterium]